MNKYALRYTAKQSILSLVRNVWLALVTALMISVSLAILGGFLLLAVNVNHIIRSIESNLEINVFLENGADIEDIALKLEGLAGIQRITFISREQGLTEFGQRLGDPDLLSELAGADNPLPDLYRVQAENAALVPELAAAIRMIDGVEIVDYGEELVERLLRITRSVNAALLVLGILIALAAVFLIVTIIRLSVMARQEEISIMKYLGAGNGFIRFPFILEGMVMGWTGTAIAVSAIALAYYRLAASLQQDALIIFLRPVTDAASILPIWGGLLLLGTIIGGFGSVISVRKYLRV